MSLERKGFGILVCLGLLGFHCLLFSSAKAQASQQKLEEFRKQGFAYVQTGDWEPAQTAFETALEIAPTDTLTLYGSSLALFNLKRYPEAVARLEVAVEILSTRKENNQLLADSLVLSAIISAVQNENALAVSKLEKATKLVPKHFDANFSLGRAYFGNGEISKAISSFQKAVSIQPSNPQARFFLATAMERDGNVAQALAEYRNVLQLRPNSAEGNLGLGVLLLKTEGDKSVEGLNALQKAVSLDANLYEAQIVLGKTLIRLNRATESVLPLQKAAGLAPNNPEPHFQLAIAYRKLGRKTEADAETEVVKKIHEKRRGVEGH